MNKGRSALSVRELLCTESTFQRCIDLVDIAGPSEVGTDIVRWVLYTTAVDRALTFALTELSCLFLRYLS